MTDVLTRPPIDPRLQARRVEVARDLGRRRRRRLVVLVAVTVLVLAGVGITRSSLLDVDHVRVAGATHVSPGQVREVAGIPTGRALLSVDPGPAVRRLEALPWVADATVAKHWPGTVSIRITEREPVAIAGEGYGAVLVDRDGMVLGPATGDEDLPTSGPDPVEGPGARLPEPRRQVVRLLADLPASILPEVERGTIDADGLGLVLHDGIRVHLGDATRLRAKTEGIETLLTQADRATIATIDVSVPGSAAVTRTSDPKDGA